MGGRSGHRRGIAPGQARLVTARFVLRQLLFFFFSAEVPHSAKGLESFRRGNNTSQSVAVAANVRLFPDTNSVADWLP